MLSSCSSNNYPNTIYQHHHYYQPYDYWQRPSYSFHDHNYYIERDKHSDTKRDKKLSDGNIRPSNKIDRPSIDKPLKRGGVPLKRSK